MALVCAILVAPAFAAPKAILFLSSVPTLGEAARSKYPNLSEFVVRNGVAVMTQGPKDADPVATLTAERYAPPGDEGWLRAVMRGGAGLEIVRPRVGATEDTQFEEVLDSAPDALIVVVGVAGPRHPWSPGHIPSWLTMSGGKGLLTSDTTRAPGVVSNLDVAPTLAAAALGQTPDGSAGHVIHAVRADGAVQRTVRLQTALEVLAIAGTPACAILGVLSVVGLVSALTVPRRQRWPGLVILAAILAPSGVAIAAGLQPRTVGAFAGWAAVATFALALAAGALGSLFASGPGERGRSVLYTALFVGVLYLVADTLTRGLATRLSPLTALFQTGVRYYGMGNEYVAVFVPAVLFVVALTLERAEVEVPSSGVVVVVGAALAVASLFTGWQNAGANMGGMLTVLAAGSVFWIGAARRAGWRHAWLPAFVVSVAITAGVVWLDATGGTPTHIGAFARKAAAGNENAVATILRSKFAIAARLATSPVFLGAVVAGVGLWRWKWLRQPLADASVRHPWAGLAARATCWGALAAVVLNDTGPVMLALMLMGAAIPLACLAREPRGLEMASGKGLPDGGSADVT